MGRPLDAALDSRTGWLVVAFGLAILVLVWGTIFTFTVYAERLATAFGLSSLRVSSIFSITTAAFFVAGGTIGILVARMPLRPVVLGTGVGIGVAVALLQVVTSYLGLAVAFGLVGAAGGTLFVIIVSLVPRWFDAYEGRAMGITLTGNGLGVLVLPFVWLWLLERTDVRGAFAVVGGATVLAVLLASFVFRRPGGADTAGGTPIDFDWLRGRLTDTRFVVALAGYALLWSWYFVLSSGLVDVLTTAGIGRRVAATAFGTVGGISVLTRVGSGAVADRVGLRETLAAGVLLAAVGVFVLVVTDTVVLMYATLVVFGVGLGAIAALFSPIIVGEFGPENATALVGMFSIAEATTAFAAPIAMDALVGQMGGYALPLLALGCLTLVGAGLFHWGTSPRRRPSG